MNELILPVIAFLLSSFSLGMAVGKLLYSWQEQTKKRNDQSNNGND